MKKTLIITAILALALCLGGSPEAGGWKTICVADSLDLTTVDTDTLIQIVDWPLTHDVGRVAWMLQETGVTTSAVEATYNFKAIYREKDGELVTKQVYWYENGTGKTAAVDLLGSDLIRGAVAEQLTAYQGIEEALAFGGQIYLEITINDATAGFVDFWVWSKSD